MEKIDSKTDPIHWALNHAIEQKTIPDSMTRADAIKAAFFLGAVAFDASLESGAKMVMAAHEEVRRFTDFTHPVSQELSERY